MSGSNAKASPEIKLLIDKIANTNNNDSAQVKYEAILSRKRYDHQCFLECVLLRLDISRGSHEQCEIQKEADQTFAHMLTHIV
jgi:hypothetical protein